MSHPFIKILQKYALTLGTVESVTGGLLADALVSLEGASGWFKGGIIPYQREAKRSWLGFDSTVMNSTGVVNDAFAKEMIIKGQKFLQTNIVIVSTGSAGPTAEMHSQVGDVFLGVGHEKHQLIKGFRLQGTRQEIRHQCVEKMWELLNEFLRTYY